MSTRSLIIPIVIAVALVWVFNRPLSALGLFVYNISGAFLHSTYENIKQTQKEAADLLEAQERAEMFESENRALVVENTKLQAQIAKIQDYESALNFKQSFSYQTTAARIIGRSPDTWHKQIIINKGSSDGIILGRGVLTDKGIVGQIAKVSPYNSVVQLIFNPDWRMGVKIARLNQYGVLSGNHPKPASLQFITVDSPVEVNDEIVTSGICIDNDNCPYPENFPVGRVVSVAKDPNIVDLVVDVEFYENLGGVKEVFVLN